MRHRNEKSGIVRRTFTCATLAVATTIALFSLVASLMSNAIDRVRSPAVDDSIPVIELTVIEGSVSGRTRSGLAASRRARTHATLDPDT